MRMPLKPYVHFNDGLAEDIIEAFRHGATLAEVARRPGMPARTTLKHWMRHRPQFGERARAMRARWPRRMRTKTRGVFVLDETFKQKIYDLMWAGHTFASLGRAQDMPLKDTLFGWQARDPEFRAQVAWIRANRPAEARPRPPQRPRPFSPAQVDEVIERLTEGEGLKSIDRDPEMPSATTVRKWANTDPVFGRRYAAARASQGGRPYRNPARAARARARRWEAEPPWADELLVRYMAGETLTDLCAEPHLPVYATVARWRRRSARFAAEFDKARKDHHYSRACRKLTALWTAYPWLRQAMVREDPPSRT